MTSYRCEEGQSFLSVSQPQVHVGGEIVLLWGHCSDTQRLSDPVLGEVQVADAVRMPFPDGHGGKERSAAVPQPQQLVVPHGLQQGAEACVVLLVQIVVVAVRVEVETPEAIGAKMCPKLNSPLHEYPCAFLEATSRQLLHLLLCHVDVRLGSQLLWPLPINVLLVPVTTPLRPPELPVNDGQATEVLSWDEVVYILEGLEQVQVQATVLWQAAVHSGTLRGVVGIVAQSVGVEDGDILPCPVSTWAPVDVEETVDVGGDVVLDDTHVQWSVPGSDEGLPTDQRVLGRFLIKGSLDEQQQTAAGQANRYDVVGGEYPAHGHYRHAGLQEEQLSIILKEARETLKTEGFK